MIELRACPACRRHVAISEAASRPFAAHAVALAPVASRPLVRGKLSRAAVFATGALAATACGGGNKTKDPVMHETGTTHAESIDAAPAPAPPADAAQVESPVDNGPARIHDHPIPSRTARRPRAAASSSAGCRRGPSSTSSKRP